MKKLINKLTIKACKLYCRLYLKRCKAGYKPSKEEVKRFCDCLYTVMTMEE